MEEKSKIRIKFEIGEIKFEAEGAADLVEKERSFFTENLLPSAIDTIVRTRNTLPNVDVDSITQAMPVIDDSENPALLSDNVTVANADFDWSRMSLASFAKSKGAIRHYDFIICAAYFNAKKNHIEEFSSSSLKELYSDAKKPEPNNMSMSLSELVKKGLIMENPRKKGITPKEYILTIDGETAVENMRPKEASSRTSQHRARKSRPKEESKYSGLNCDELNLSNYPEIKNLNNFKEKMLLAMYVVTNESKGEWFTVEDILCVLTDVLGESATRKQVEGVFTREKRWFKTDRVDEGSKIIRRKLLNEGKDFARSLQNKRVSPKN